MRAVSFTFPTSDFRSPTSDLAPRHSFNEGGSRIRVDPCSSVVKNLPKTTIFLRFMQKTYRFRIGFVSVSYRFRIGFVSVLDRFWTDFQTPPRPPHVPSLEQGVWKLELGASLELGAWKLAVFFSIRTSNFSLRICTLGAFLEVSRLAMSPFVHFHHFSNGVTKGDKR